MIRALLLIGALAASTPAPSSTIDWRVDGDRISLAPSDADRLFTAIDLVESATTAAARQREARIACEVDARAQAIADAAARKSLEAALEAAQPSWIESPILWLGIGTILGAGVAIGAARAVR